MQSSSVKVVCAGPRTNRNGQETSPKSLKDRGVISRSRFTDLFFGLVFATPLREHWTDLDIRGIYTSTPVMSAARAARRVEGRQEFTELGRGIGVKLKAGCSIWGK